MGNISSGKQSSRFAINTKETVNENNLNGLFSFGSIDMGHSMNFRSVNSIILGAIAYCVVCGGPTGIEDAIRYAGPAPTFAAILLLPFLWSFPEIFVSAELSSMNASNGGCVVWVQRAFGNFGGFINAWNLLLCLVIDLSLYPMLFVDFVERYIPSISERLRWMSYAIAIIFTVLLNTQKLNVIGLCACLFTCIIIAPYFLQTFIELPHIEVAKLTAIVSHKTTNWPLFFNTMLWSFSGWDVLGSFSGEVKNPHTTYINGMMIGMFCTIISYLVPLAVSVSISSFDWDRWKHGYFITLSSQIYPWMWTFTLISAIVSAFASFVVNLACYSRFLWSMGALRFLPSPFSYCLSSNSNSPTLHAENLSSKVPIGAVLFLGVSTSLLCAWNDFESLVQVSTCLNCIRLTIEFASFVWLKKTEPNADRPFEIPGGVTGALFLAAPKILLIVLNLYITSFKTWFFCLGANFVFLFLYYLWNKNHFRILSSSWGPPDDKYVEKVKNRFFRSSRALQDDPYPYKPEPSPDTSIDSHAQRSYEDIMNFDEEDDSPLEPLLNLSSP